MKITVIIPALDEAEQISGCLRSLSLQTMPKEQFDVVLVDNGSTDETVTIAASFVGDLNLRIVSRTKASISGTRNFGASLSDSEVLAFLDADCLCRPDWLERAVAMAPEAGIWGAHYMIPSDRPG